MPELGRSLTLDAVSSSYVAVFGRQNGRNKTVSPDRPPRSTWRLIFSPLLWFFADVWCCHVNDRSKGIESAETASELIFRLEIRENFLQLIWARFPWRWFFDSVRLVSSDQNLQPIGNFEQLKSSLVVDSRSVKWSACLRVLKICFHFREKLQISIFDFTLEKRVKFSIDFNRCSIRGVESGLLAFREI